MAGCIDRWPHAAGRAFASPTRRRCLDVKHILAGGSLEPHGKTIERLKAQLAIVEDLLRPAAEATREAYAIQGERIAYARPDRPRAARADSEEAS